MTSRGRPRDAGRDAVILDATRSLLIELGYERLSMEAVASRAAVSKATIYRRYPDKASLVAAAADRQVAGAPPDRPSAGLREALLDTVAWLAREIAEQEIGLLGALFAGMRGDPELAAAMRRLLHRDQAAMTEAPLRRARERGTALAPHAAELFAEIAPALIVHRLLVAGEPCDQRFLEHLVDDVLVPLLRTGTEHS